MRSCARVISMSTYLVKLIIMQNCYSISRRFSLRQLVAPTHLTCNSATILDLIFISSSINVIEWRSQRCNHCEWPFYHTTLAILRSHVLVMSVSHNIHAIRPEDIEYELRLLELLVPFICVACWWDCLLRSLLLQFLTDSPQLLVGVFLAPSPRVKAEWCSSTIHWAEETCPSKIQAISVSCGLAML